MWMSPRGYTQLGMWDLFDIWENPGVELYWMGQAMKSAVKNGDLKMIKHIHDLHPEPLGVDFFAVAVEFGQLEAWFMKHRSDGVCCNEPPNKYDKGSVECCFWATGCKRTHVEVAKWLHTKGYSRMNGFEIGDEAAERGDLEMVKWLYSLKAQPVLTPGAWSNCVTQGHLDVLRFLHEHQVQEPEEDLLSEALGHGRTEVAAYLRENKISTEISPNVVLYAGYAGRLDVVQAYSHFLDLDSGLIGRVLNAAAGRKSLDVVE